VGALDDIGRSEKEFLLFLFRLNIIIFNCFIQLFLFSSLTDELLIDIMFPLIYIIVFILSL